MRNHHFFIAFPLFVCNTDVFARGGLGSAFADMIEWTTLVAIFCGFFVGAISAYFSHRMPWKPVLIAWVAIFGIAVLFPIVGFFLAIATIAFSAVFASVFYVLRGLFHLRWRLNLESQLSSKSRIVDSFIVSNILHWMATTYVFSIAVALINIQLLGFLVLTPFAVFIGTNEKLLSFILPPLAIAFCVSLCITTLTINISRLSRYTAPFIFNISVLMAFFISAEVYRSHLMSESLQTLGQGRLDTSSFLNSVLKYQSDFRGPHATFSKDGKTYHWSYSERKFIQYP